VAFLLLASPRVSQAQVQGELRGRITDASSARPVVGARIEVVGRSGLWASATDGTFVIRGLEPRTYSLRVRALGYAPRELEVEVANAITTSIELALRASVTELSVVAVRASRDTSTVGAIHFDRQAIESSGARDVGELLQRVPGVVVTQSGGPGAATHVSIQGSSASEVLVLVDGVPYNSVTSGSADLSRLSLESVERVVVRTGAASSRYGARALAGVIEIETRRPEHDASLLLRGGAWGERDAAFSLGESRQMGPRRAGFSLTGDYRTLLGDFPYAVPALRGGGTSTRINSDLTSHQLLGGLSLASDSAELRLHGSWEQTERGLAGSIVQPSTTGREVSSRVAGGVDGQWRRGQLSGTENGMVTHERAAIADPSPPFGGVYDDVVNATALTAQASATLDQRFASTSAGGDAQQLRVESTALDTLVPHAQRLLGAWANTRLAPLSLPGSTELRLELSGRLDWSSLLSGVTASPRAAATLSHGLLVMTSSIGSGYSPPTLADQFFHEGVLVRANPGLRPERVSHDLATRLAVHDLRAGPFVAGGGASVFRADIDGMILWLPDFRFIWSPSNFDVHRSGWDAGGQLAVPSMGLDLQGTMSRTDVSYAGPVLTGQVAYRPRTTGSIVAGMSRGGVRLEASTRYVGDRRTVPSSALNALDPYWLTDARISTAFTRRGWTYDARVGVENALDRNASMLVDYPFPSRTWTVALRMRRGRSGAT
jgi:outer membrane cobalamin receptor